MSEDLKQRIKQFNKIKFANDKSKRIIISLLTPTVTQGCKDKE